MSRDRQVAVWLLALIAFATLLVLFRGILLPFVAGMLLAYMLDPLVDRLQRWRMSRTLSVCLVLLAFFVVAMGVLVVVLPPLQSQLVRLVNALPDLVDTVREAAQPVVERLWDRLTEEELERIRTFAASHAGSAVTWITGLLGNVWRGGLALLDLLSLLVITPLVAFYLMRDWDYVVAFIDRHLPRGAQGVIRGIFQDIDATIAGFVRGQATVCTILATFYAVSLGLVGLKYGLLIGLGAGIISFIPYVGAAVGLVTGVTVAWFQFHDIAWTMGVGAIFVVGQLAESYLLTPRLVGDRVGLHPVWLIFALMAGGALFGFTGVLLGVPVAAVIGVLVRFWLGRYRASRLYLGDARAVGPGDGDAGV